MIRKVARLALGFWLVFHVGYVNGQHPLVGTWRMISIKGKGADGEPFNLDTTSVREIKVITPTHYMLIAYTVDGDSLIFNRAYAGTVSIEGSRYLEKPELSSLPIFDNVSSNFTWRLDGGRFIQSGSFVRPDGKTVFLDEMIFEKVSSPLLYTGDLAIGAWRLASVSGDGRTEKNMKGIQLITPTHWMQLILNAGKFEEVLLGTYQIRGGKLYPNIKFTSGRSQAFKIEASINGQVLTENLSEVNGSRTFSRVWVFEK